MHRARVSIGKTSLAVRYAALAPAEAKKKMTAPISVSVIARQAAEHEPGDREQHAGEDVGAGDHPDPADACRTAGSSSRAPTKLLAAKTARYQPGLLDAEERASGCRRR